MKKINLNEIISASNMAELSNNVMDEIDGGCIREHIWKKVSGGLYIDTGSSTLRTCADKLAGLPCVETHVNVYYGYPC